MPSSSPSRNAARRSSSSRGRNARSSSSVAPERAESREKHHVVPALLPLLAPIDSLVPDPANARKHGERNLEAIKASLAARGQHAPLVAQEGSRIVRVGNGRLAAMRALGWTHAAVVFVAENDVEAAARALADNRAGDLAFWDGQNLAAAMRDLRDAGAAEGLAFTEDELARARGEFAAPTNGQEVLGSIADGLRVRGSLLVTCPRERVPAVVAAIRAAFEAEGLASEDWTVEAKGASGNGSASPASARSARG